MPSLIERDLQHIWHPCSQMKDFEQYPPLVVHAAQGCYLFTDKGDIIDAIASWWCKSLGHRHPRVIQAIQKQLEQFEHIISATTTHNNLVQFGEKISQITHKQHVLFANDGSSAVEIAMKLCLHAKQIQGQAHRTQFIALRGGYHGETFATLSVSDLGQFKEPYAGYGVHCHFIQNLPYVDTEHDPLWTDATQAWELTLAELEPIKDHCCAVIVEPVIQGAHGMRLYSADFLFRLAEWARKNGLFLIVDEIMTGIGRTGKWLASEHAGINPDLICLSKGLTAGTIPMSCVAVDHAIYELFYGDYHPLQSFLHSHTFSANSLAIAAALATIEVIEQESLLTQATSLGKEMVQAMQYVSNATGCLGPIRSLGAIVATEVNFLTQHQQIKNLENIALQHGILLRPLGNTLYWLPPLTMRRDTLEQLAERTLQTLVQCKNSSSS